MQRLGQPGTRRSVRLLVPDDAGSSFDSWRDLFHEIGQRFGLEVQVGPEQGAAEHNGDIVTISDSAMLSRALLRNFTHFRVIGPEPAKRLNASLADELSMPLERAPRPRCSLITSLFDGDRFVRGFLDNGASLAQLASIEHFIVRPASPGRLEHGAILEHMKRHPNVVYLQLRQDPGLYEVWNLCARLSSAPYLSSANVDDRRAPDHPGLLADILDAHPEVDVASTALRVTEQENLPWEESEDCPAWYAEEPSERYDVNRLWRATGQGIRAYNIPHCMPLWRGRLHVLHGGFDEGRFGPSADWEFWLRVGKAGSLFHIHPAPGGLHLRSPSSYWRSRPHPERDTARIIGAHLAPGTARSAGLLARPEGGFRGFLRDLDARLDAHDPLGFFQRLLAFNGSYDGTGWGHRLRRARLARHLRRRLGVEGLGSITPTPSLRGIDGIPGSLAPLYGFLVDGLHRLDGEENGVTAIEWLLDALTDLEPHCHGAAVPLARAYALRRLGRADLEAALLARTLAACPSHFWPLLQGVYRFSVPLRELTTLACGDDRFEDLAALESCDTVRFFPDYRRGNPYQALLYGRLQDAGVTLEGIAGLDGLLAAEPDMRPGDVLHIHWINGLQDRPGEAVRPEAIQAFLDCIDALATRGVRLWWTVHNRYSHEVHDTTAERAFRRQLCERMDRVLVHHPCLLKECSEWLEDGPKVRFLEHGNYLDAYDQTTNRPQARRSLGYRDSDRVLAIVGMLKPYKQTAPLLERLGPALTASTRLRLLQAGPIHCEATRTALQGLPPGRWLSQEGFVPAKSIQDTLLAADFALLSYRDILTSGSAFLALGFGVPVIAPRLGSLPAYIIDGWNGFLYTTLDEFDALIAHIDSLPPAALERLRSNARATAQSLRWPGAA